MTQPSTPGFVRRTFLHGAATVAAAPHFLAAAEPKDASRVAPRKIKLGVVGNGGRGSWIARLFAKHGGYQMHAVADYFQENADKLGDALDIDKARRFSGLSGCRRLIESGVEAVVLKTPAYFFQEHAAEAVGAGVHVYMAKPVAVDVPGCLKIESLGREATGKKLVFLVDYQMPTDPANQLVRQAIGDGVLGKLARVLTSGISGGHADPPREATVANRLKDLVWCNDIALGGGYISTFDIHCIDAAVWTLGRRPVSAMGLSRIARPTPHGDSHDVSAVVYQYDDGLIHEHFGQALPNRTPGEITCRLFSHNACAMLAYGGKAFYEVRGQKRVEAAVDNLYEAGAMRNIAAFHQAIIEGRCDNATVARAVSGSLTAILGREACARGEKLTMDQLLKENKPYEPDLRGLKT